MGDKYLDQILLPRSRIRDSANGAPQQRTADESLQFRVPEIGVSLLWISDNLPGPKGPGLHAADDLPGPMVM